MIYQFLTYLLHLTDWLLSSPGVFATYRNDIHPPFLSLSLSRPRFTGDAFREKWILISVVFPHYERRRPDSINLRFRSFRSSSQTLILSCIFHWLCLTCDMSLWVTSDTWCVFIRSHGNSRFNLFYNQAIKDPINIISTIVFILCKIFTVQLAAVQSTTGLLHWLFTRGLIFTLAYFPFYWTLIFTFLTVDIN